MTMWLELVLSLPTENATARMRAWRALKSSGAAVLRDGVYLLPQRDACRALLEGVADDVRAAGGAAYLLRVSGDGDGTDADNGVDSNFVALFDRSADFATLLVDIASARDGLNAATAPDTLKQARKLAKALANLVETDFFPGEARRQTEGALADLEAMAHRALSPHEPSAVARAIPRLVTGGGSAGAVSATAPAWLCASAGGSAQTKQTAASRPVRNLAYRQPYLPVRRPAQRPDQPGTKFFMPALYVIYAWVFAAPAG